MSDKKEGKKSFLLVWAIQNHGGQGANLNDASFVRGEFFSGAAFFDMLSNTFPCLFLTEQEGARGLSAVCAVV